MVYTVIKNSPIIGVVKKLKKLKKMVDKICLEWYYKQAVSEKH